MKSSNFSKWVKIIILLVCLGGFAGLGFYLRDKYRQIQQIQQVDRLLAQKEYSAAITAYDRLLQTDIAQPHLLWINRGYALLGLNRYHDMLKSCSKAIAIEPETALAWNCRGEALYHLNRNREALEAFERASAIDPQQDIFWLNQAIVLNRLEQYDRAIAACDKAIQQLARESSVERSSREAIALERKGQSLLKINRHQQALTAFEQSLAYSPNYLPAKQGTAVALYELGRYERAITAFESILRSKDLSLEQTAIAMFYLANSLCQTQKTTAASKVFADAIELTDNPQLKARARKGCGLR